MLLLTGSPAIDHGNIGTPEIDQRGLLRPLDFLSIANASGGDGADIGAVEADLPQSGDRFEGNTLDDHDDGVASYYDCTLREAIRTASAAPDPTVITFRPGLRGTISLQAPLGSLTLSNSISLIGPGARHLTVDAGLQVRIFHVVRGSSEISGLTLHQGKAPATSVGRQARGGAILNEATLTLVDCWVHDSSAVGGAAFTTGTGGAGYGGGVAISPGGTFTARLNGRYRISKE